MSLLNDTVANMYQLRRYNNVATTPPDRPLGDLLNSIAIASGVSSAVRKLYVDPVNGNDDNDGLVETQVAGTDQGPLQTIQLAVLMFKLPWLQRWAKGANRTVLVKHTAGMDDIKEQIVIPPHVGDGILILQFEEEVVAENLVQNGAFTPVAGYVARQTVPLVGNPLGAGDLADNAFLTLTDRDTVEPEAAIAVLNDLPIVDNGTGDITVDAYGVGFYCAYDYGDGKSLRVVRPQIAWTFPDDNDSPGFDFGASLIQNMGGRLIVQGVTLKALSKAGGSVRGPFLENWGNNDNNSGQICILNRVHFKPGDFNDHVTPNEVVRLTTGDAVAAIATLFQYETTGPLCSGRNCYFLNMRFHDGFGDLWPVVLQSTGLFLGMDCDSTGAHFIVRGSEIVFSGDFRNRNVRIESGSHVGNLDVSIEGVADGDPCLAIGLDANELDPPMSAQGACRVAILQAIGSTGNTGVGCRIGPHSYVIRGAGAVTTLTGSADLQVGQAAATQAWGAGSATDKAAARPDFAIYIA